MRLDKLKREEAFQTICSGGSNAADRITFTLIVRMWRQEVIRAAKRRVVAEVEECFSGCKTCVKSFG
eukprot:4717933-Amphidinium_carterae.1